MRKEREVVGGVKSLVHCRCQTLTFNTFTPRHHQHLHVNGPCLLTCYVPLPQGPLVTLLSFIILSLTTLLSVPSLLSSDQLGCLMQEGRRKRLCVCVCVCEGGRERWGGGAGGVRHIEFAKSGRTIDRKPGRKEDEPLPMKCHCLCDVT